MQKTLSLLTLAGVESTLRELHREKMPVKTAIKVSLQLKTLAPVCDAFREKVMAIWQEHTVLSDDKKRWIGKGETDDEKTAAVSAAKAEQDILAAVTDEVKVYPLTVAELDGMKLSPAQLLLLDELFDFLDESESTPG